MATFRCDYSFSKIFLLQSLDGGQYGRTGTRLCEDHLEHLCHSGKAGLKFVEAIGSRQQFIREMDAIFEEARVNTNIYPIIHIEAHGFLDPHSGDCVGLRMAESGDLVSWSDLAGLCRRVNRLARNNLLLVLASCHGYAAITEVDLEQLTPFFAIIGPTRAILENDLVSRFGKFYRAFFFGVDLNQATEDLGTEFSVTFAEEILARVAGRAFLDSAGSRTARQQHVEEVVTRVRDGFPGGRPPVHAVRKVVKPAVRLDSVAHRQIFEETARRFLLSDHPENRGRFNLGYDALLRILQRTDEREGGA